MFGLILRAIASRRAPSITLFLLTVLSAGAAAAAPQYIAMTTRELAAATAEAAPVDARTVTLRRDLDQREVRPDSVENAVREVSDAIGLPELAVRGTFQVNGSIVENGRSTNLLLAYRTGFCDHVVLAGACPSRPGEVAIDEATSRRFKVKAGDRLAYAPGFEKEPFTVSAVYRITDPFSDYWAASRLPIGGTPVLAPVLTTPETIVAANPQSSTLVVDAVGGRDLFAHVAPLTVRDRIVRANPVLGQRGYESQTPLRVLAVNIYNSQLDIVYAVPISLVELLAFCWIALFLAVRHGALERHRDIGLLKLRGTAQPRILTLTLGQSGVPMLAGGLAGLAAAIPLRAGGGIANASASTTDLLSVGAAVVTVLGAILAAAIAERRALAAPVALLMRAVPPRRSGWRYGAVDGVLVILALACAYEAWSYASRDPVQGVAQQSTWLALLAPALLAFALGVVLARLVGPAAAEVGRRALRTGRLGVAFTATELARRPAVPRLTALLTAAVTLFCVAVTTSDTTARSGEERAATEIGADRVLRVSAPNRATLLAATRAIDPQGRFLMAVVSSPRVGVLAVDATRLAAVARWRGEYGGTDVAAVAARLRPPLPEPLTVTGSELTLTATALRGGATVLAILQAADGAEVEVDFGLVTGGRTDYRQPAQGCAAGCRLVSFEILGVGTLPEGAGPPGEPPPEYPAPDAVRFSALRGTGGGIDTPVFADRARWRTPNGLGQVAAALSVTPEGLVVTPDNPVNSDPMVLVDESPERLPAIAAGVKGAEFSAADPHLQAFPGNAIPVAVAGAAHAVPIVGRDAMLIDLETADAMTGDLGGGESLQVWATDAAPADLVDRLAEHHVETYGSGTIAELADRYARQAPPSTIRFQLVAAALMVLLAAGALGVIVAVERRPRGAELAALRQQGLTARTARRAMFGGYLVVAAVALVAGLVAAVPARTILAAPLSVFPDRWDVLPAPAALRPGPLFLAAAAAAVVFALVVLLASGRPRRDGGEST
ncbi:FtsX-like permease family protein [Asanoa hainanensis]|uniref:FtsX-like permease family protein n=1 Tax=Asanoa hainanensis TaxID=560556 RepID=A0A239KBT6_9ACTN|nr:FtsX-like permease family protein [Asanoa hainanensis]SNT15430.1 FtsX-like permease family protein [Asanoa hainanensis]